MDARNAKQAKAEAAAFRDGNGCHFPIRNDPGANVAHVVTETAKRDMLVS